MADTPLRIGGMTLVVHDLEGVRRFYEDVVGLRQLSGDAGSARLGAGGIPLLDLRRDRDARLRSPREAGLFHAAFLLPTRAALGRWVVHAAATRAPIQGASDHVVSEALYLADPEGNGVEIYADRPRSAWAWSGDTVVMRTDPLDIDDLVGAADGAWGGAPDGTTLGHMHLQVGAIPPAEAFYAGVLGFPLTARYPGGSFYGSAGYHHHVATNIWNSRGAGVRQVPSTGLADFEIRASGREILDAVEARALSAGHLATRQPSGLSLRDPWGTAIRLVGPEP